LSRQWQEADGSKQGQEAGGRKQEAGGRKHESQCGPQAGQMRSNGRMKVQVLVTNDEWPMTNDKQHFVATSASCRLPPASCRLPPASCSLPSAPCLLRPACSMLGNVIPKVAMLCVALTLSTDILAQKISDLEKYEQYYHALRREVQSEVESAEFLGFRRLPQSQRAAFEARLKDGVVLIEQIEAKKRPNGKLDAALIHHWRGTVLIPRTSLSKIIAFAQNYDQHSKFFKEDVIESRLLSRKGNFFRVFYKLRRKKVITVYYNTEYDGTYRLVTPTRQWSENRATKIAELEDVGEPTKKEKPRGQDHGFLWKLDSFFKYDQFGDGVIIECTSLSLSRDIPFGLGFMIGKFVQSIPRESLERTLRTFTLAR
jgi:hypothetical protein